MNSDQDHLTAPAMPSPAGNDLPAENQKVIIVEAASLPACPICGLPHLKLPVVKLDQPTIRGYTHVGTCPNKGKEIYLRKEIGQRPKSGPIDATEDVSATDDICIPRKPSERRKFLRKMKAAGK